MVSESPRSTPRSAIPLTRERRESGDAVFMNPLCRALNVVVALVGIAVTLPFMLVIAVAIRLSSPGPVLFTQPRVGVDRRRGVVSDEIMSKRKEDLGGRVFTIYKFRTMRPETGTPSQVWATAHDPRITTVGRFLRKTRLDELPQLFNVLQGDMNIVGPRPEQPRIFQELRDRIENYQHRQRVLPGITGWAQVNLSYDQNLDDVRRKVALDLEYIEERSVTRDFIIMLKTLPVMLFRKGAV
jgi:lipopolysaccharide/colanic/teichoic acid biosynthesis glycosyltransferase